MATPKAQRIGIWIITLVMVFGVVGSFAVMILSSQNQTDDLNAQRAQLAQYYTTLAKYKSEPAAFDPTAVGSTVTTQDLKNGTGEAIGKSTNYQAYYIGWNPSGKIFDSSFATDGTSLNPAIDTAGVGLIKGWSDGVQGMKIGGVREVTIPGPLAYGSASPTPDIPANSPLKFIIYVIKKD